MNFSEIDWRAWQPGYKPKPGVARLVEEVESLRRRVAVLEAQGLMPNETSPSVWKQPSIEHLTTASPRFTTWRFTN